MKNRTRIINDGRRDVVWPGNIPLPQYQERARRCSACEHRLQSESHRCALMPDQLPYNRGVGIVMTQAHIECPEGRWQDDAAPMADIVEHLQPIDEPHNVIKRIAHGAIGLTKATLGIERSDDATIAARYALCMACDRHAIGLCTACGCLCAAKVRVAGEACPEGKWSAAPARQAE